MFGNFPKSIGGHVPSPSNLAPTFIIALCHVMYNVGGPLWHITSRKCLVCYLVILSTHAGCSCFIIANVKQSLNKLCNPRAFHAMLKNFINLKIVIWILKFLIYAQKVQYMRHWARGTHTFYRQNFFYWYINIRKRMLFCQIINLFTPQTHHLTFSQFLTALR